MKKTFIFFTAAALVFGLNLKGITNSSTPPAGYTGAPGDSNCTSCHGGVVNNGPGSVLVTAPVTAYVPGTQYTVQVTVTDATKQRFGFELVALNAANAQAGSFTVTSATTTATQVSGGKTYVSHRNANTTVKNWSFIWTAPATNVGPVTFYVAGNASNNNSTDSGDNIYTSSLVLAPAAPNGIKEEITGRPLFHPNPAREKVNLNLPANVQKMRLLDVTGKEVFSTSQPASINQLDLSRFNNGQYLLQTESEAGYRSDKLLIQK